MVVDPTDLFAVLDVLETGGVIAIPTDTVYGLAARIDRPTGIQRIFELKQRPAELSLPVLIGSTDQVHGVARVWPPVAERFASRFWPGPLTLVVPAVGNLGELLGGVDTVGIRLPDHHAVTSLCTQVGPLAVTSANLHGQPPCTTSQDVQDAFASTDLAVVIDGGICDGIPSTVVDCTATLPTLVREGAISWSLLERELGTDREK